MHTPTPLPTFQKSLHLLNKYTLPTSLNKLEQLGLIHCFNLTHHWATTTLHTLFKQKYPLTLYGPLDTTKKAHELGYIQKLNLWLDMFKTQTLCQSFHSPTEDAINTILGQYLPEYNTLQIKLS